MNLTIGECYAVLLTNGAVVQFRFLGCDGNGQVVIEVPPGTGNRVPFNSVVTSYQAYWPIPAPQNQKG